MRPISPRVKQVIEESEFYDRCIRYKEDNCEGRITMEHVFTYGGRQIDEVWAIVPVCAKHHEVDNFQDGGGMDKKFHEWVAIKRMTPADKAKYDRVNWDQRETYLDTLYERERLPDGI